MSDITERLRREWWQVSDEDCKTAANEIERLRAEVAGLREDAQRYRWLRSQVSGHRAVSSARPATFAFPGPMALTPLGDIMRGSVAQHLDAAIDAARKGEA